MAWDGKKLPDSLAIGATNAANAALNGAKNLAYLNYVQTQIGSSLRLKLLREDVVVWEATATGPLSIVSTKIVLPTSFTQVSISAADIDTGEWICRVEAADDATKYITTKVTPTVGAGPFKLTGDLTTGGTINIGLSLLNSPSFDVVSPSTPTPPGGVSEWLLQTTDTPVVVPSTFMGIHSDYLPAQTIGGVSYSATTFPVNPNIQSSLGTVRNLNFDPDRGWTTRLSWALMEPNANGVYVWTYMDRWVAANSGKQLIYCVDRTPYPYAKYNAPWSDTDFSIRSKYNGLYPSLRDSSSPPADWTKALNLVIAILNRYPTENIHIEIGNEANFGYNDTGLPVINTSNQYTARWDVAYADALIAKGRSGSGYFTGSPIDLADGAKALRQGLDAAGWGSTPSSGKRFVRLFGPGWEGQGESTTLFVDNSAQRFSNAPCTGGGTGKDFVDIFSFHSYTYNGDGGARFLGEAKNYRTIANNLGYTGKPRHCTEIGHETATGSDTVGLAYNYSDDINSTNLIRWSFIGAALGVQSMCYYRLHSASPDGSDVAGNRKEARNLKYYSVENTAPRAATNAAFRTAFNTAAVVNGKTITQAAKLTDNRIWLAFSDGTTAVR